jgi:myo-inositol 2-dehydrogenase/D-chiro-inositol 1-dehydrogenase
MRIGLVGVGRIGAFHAATLKGLDTEARVDFPAALPYTDFMERFPQAYVDELAAFTDLDAGRIETPCSVSEALQAFLVAEAWDLSVARVARCGWVSSGDGDHGATHGP